MESASVIFVPLSSLTPPTGNLTFWSTSRQFYPSIRNAEIPPHNSDSPFLHIPPSRDFFSSHPIWLLVVFLCKARKLPPQFNPPEHPVTAPILSGPAPAPYRLLRGEHEAGPRADPTSGPRSASARHHNGEPSNSQVLASRPLWSSSPFPGRSLTRPDTRIGRRQPV